MSKASTGRCGAGSRRLWGVLALMGMVWCAAGCSPRPPEGIDLDLPGLLAAGEETALESPPLRPDPPALGPEAPYTPIIHPPDVQRVWIPSRINAYGDLAAGHWIYLKIRDAEWFLKRRDDSARQRMQLDLPMVPTIRSQDPEAPENQVER